MKGMTAAHNKVRTTVGAPALIWSEDLSQFAQKWADYLGAKKNCAVEHRPEQGQYAQAYGENLYWASSIRWSGGKREVRKITPDQVVETWAQEALSYEYETGSCYPGKACGHYTQLVWARTRKVGCGRAICPDKSQVWVCNYDPPGNYIGEKPY